MQTELENIIIDLRGIRVVLDIDLAMLYGVTAKRLNEQVKRNKERFPNDFMFRLNNQEVSQLRSQFATAKWTMRRSNPYAFTEHGVVMAANVLNSRIAINASILLVRTFMKMRSILAEHVDLKKRLQEIERRIAKGFSQHEQELQEIRFMIAQLEKPIETKKGRLGF